jgi:hypothetical protein
MPWSETTKMRERMRFVLDAEEGLFTMTELADARRAHPFWGARQLIRWLARRHPGLGLPAPSTAGEILKTLGLVKPRRQAGSSERVNAADLKLRSGQQRTQKRAVDEQRPCMAG